MDLIIDRTKALFDKGLSKEVLTVDNHADGPYLYLRMLREDPERAAEVLELLKMNEGNNSGRGIGCGVSWGRRGVCRPVLAPPTASATFASALSPKSGPNRRTSCCASSKTKKQYVTGRCAGCAWLDICGGNFRVRAEAVTGDVWAPDPACYLTDEEIAQTI